MARRQKPTRYPMKCEGCGVNYAHPPSYFCPACQDRESKMNVAVIPCRDERPLGRAS